MQVVNVRGTTSSGKTTLLRNLIQASKMNNIVSLTEHVKGHMLDDVVTIGTYKKTSKFGGVDAIAKISYVEPAIEKALTMKPLVVFEGLLISHSYERWKDYSARLKKLQKKHGVKTNGLVWVFTLPTFRENLRRLANRNNIGGSVREVKGDKFIMNFVQRYKSMQRIHKKAVNDGEAILRLPNLNPFAELRILLDSINDGKTLTIKKSGIRNLI